MEAVHVVEIALMEIGHGYRLDACFTARPTNLLHIIHKGARGGYVIDSVDVGDIHTHAKGRSGYNDANLIGHESILIGNLFIGIHLSVER